MKHSRATGMEIIKKLAVDFRLNFDLDTTTYRKTTDKIEAGSQTDIIASPDEEIYVNDDGPFDRDQLMIHEGRVYAASDASLQIIHGMVRVAWACVFGQFSRHNRAEILEGSTSTTGGELNGAIHGITHFFNDVCRSQHTKLTWWCDNLTTVNIIDHCIQKARAKENVDQHIEFALKTIANMRLDNPKMANFLNTMIVFGDRVEIRHIYSHKGRKTKEAILNDIADTEAKRCLKRYYAQFPLLSDLDGQANIDDYISKVVTQQSLQD